MTHPGLHARTRPDHPAIIMAGSDEMLTYRQLDERSNQIAHLFRSVGLERGDHVAIFMENQIRFMEIVWAALRSGLHITAVNSFLATDEVAYILDDCDTQVVVSSRSRSQVAADLDPATIPNVKRWLMVDGVPDTEAGPAWEPFEDVISGYPTTPIDDESPGYPMLYSSGTTGRPKGVKRPLPDRHIDEPDPRMAVFADKYSFGPDTVYLSPAPLYHAAPMAFSIGVHRLGGTLVVMEKFDARTCLATIESKAITHAQFVPTMFVRMLKLDEADRQSFDVSSLKVAIHAAAPCPVPIKHQMIDWWGPIISEYYAGSEGMGSTFIDSAEWLEKPGSVGRASVGTLHICDDEGNELAPGETGGIYFSKGGEYEYHKAPEKTAASSLPGGRTTLGDIGYMDEDGYLFLTDRKAHMIISGGVNIYPQEIEDLLITHPAVFDVAVFGVPDAEMGEQVKAVVQVADSADADDRLGATLIEFCRTHIAHYKCPKSVDFEDELPRLPTGKLYKRLLRDRYWADSTPG